MLKRSNKWKRAWERNSHARVPSAMTRLIEDAAKIMVAQKKSRDRDTALIAAAQKIEQHEIAAYRTLCAWAKTPGTNTNWRRSNPFWTGRNSRIRRLPLWRRARISCRKLVRKVAVRELKKMAA